MRPESSPRHISLHDWQIPRLISQEVHHTTTGIGSSLEAEFFTATTAMNFFNTNNNGKTAEAYVKVQFLQQIHDQIIQPLVRQAPQGSTGC